jgi:hypothetical protein
VKAGYLASVVGSAIGAVTLGVGGVVVGFVLADNATDGKSAEALGEVFGDLFGIVVVAILVTMAGLWIGATVGCWLGLKVAGHQREGRSALLLAVLLPVWVVALSVALNALFGDVPDAVRWIAVAATVVVPPLAARSLALRGAT